ncbi:MAG: MAPEG family protein [Moraxellaceae bacterium]|nr:MAPEG family protein [Moraxellaceae bacterium]
MSPAICALICFTLLTAVLGFAYPLQRIALVLTGKASANAWKRGAQTAVQPAWSVRVQNAHLNCLENLPLFAAVILAAYISDQLAVIEGLAMIYLALRVAQSLVHVISDSASFVFVRANLWVPQMLILFYWLLSLCGVF